MRLRRNHTRDDEKELLDQGENESFISLKHAYVKNISLNKVGSVSGMLLYPVIDDKYHSGGNKVYVRTVDLGSNLENIRKILMEIRLCI